MKNSFVLYTDYMKHIALLDMEERGELLTVIMAYQSGDELPLISPKVEIVFSFIRAQLDKDNAKYEETCKKRAEAGRLGGRPKANGSDEKAKKANGFLEKQTKAKKPDNENDNDIKKKDTYVSKEKASAFKPPNREEVLEYCKEKNIAVDVDYFMDYYESNGWKVGKNPMKDWRATVRNWSRNRRQGMTTEGNTQRQGMTTKGTKFSNAPEREYNMMELERRLVQ